jgi:hypothetical protein
MFFPYGENVSLTGIQNNGQNYSCGDPEDG